MANNSGSVLAAFLGGAIVGGIAALLFAPKSGAQLRQEVMDELERYKNDCACGCHCGEDCECGDDCQCKEEKEEVKE